MIKNYRIMTEGYSYFSTKKAVGIVVGKFYWLYFISIQGFVCY